MCPWVVLGMYLGVFVESLGLLGRSKGRPWCYLEILGDTLWVLGCSWGLLRRFRGGSWGSFGESCRGLVPLYATQTHVSALSFFRFSGVTFGVCFAYCLFICVVSFICSSYTRTQQLSTLAVLAHSGASSLGVLRHKGCLWETPWLGRSGGRPGPHMACTPMIQRFSLLDDPWWVLRA